MNDKLVYGPGAYSSSELQDLIAKLIAEAGEDSELRQEVERYGVDPSQLSPDSISVRQDRANLDPVTASLIIAFAAKPVKDVWTYVFLPRLRRRWGRTVVGEEKKADG
ncbi:hypothetical protein F7Q99_36975 [Streptomyces kaniharaensis]|uniref:Uncharacterized protein n=1 Tax=Streptomyces kaniharaensis TaxID=212423 RepID=A0A6N7L0Y7_9ACTN|nr:hypothetical protein [Streptomyces kaniharaensis]MQS17636.1 hypothetical protein [Streptomyces kaniharaensis]